MEMLRLVAAGGDDDLIAGEEIPTLVAADFFPAAGRNGEIECFMMAAFFAQEFDLHGDGTMRFIREMGDIAQVAAGRLADGEIDGQGGFAGGKSS